MSSVIPPGSTLGVLGSGQLGRMFAIAARRMGYRVHVLSPDDDTPTGQVADLEIRAAYDDLDAVAAFARGVSVVTFEFENVPTATTEVCERFAPVRPGGNVLHTTQNRIREKTFLKTAGIPVTPFKPIHSLGDLQAAIRPEEDLPIILKTAEWGYDGKGQVKIESTAEINDAWKRLGDQTAIMEEFIGLQSEVSVVAARALQGQIVTYGPIQNVHSQHILDFSILPASIPSRLADEAIEIARDVMRRLDVVGVLCVEFFIDDRGRLMVNELAPRPHNSGHLTIDACSSCQFEQQVRAVCGLPLGSTRQHRPAAMANLLGDVWQNGEPRWSEALALSDVKLHLYGKAEPRVGRKMGHLTALGDTAEEARRRVVAARECCALAEDSDSGWR